jgi:hypothetical protein
MGQFKPMVKMMTTEPSVELKLKKGGSVKMQAGGLSGMGTATAQPAMPARGGMAAARAPMRPSMAARRRAMMAMPAAAAPAAPVGMAGRMMKEGGESKAMHAAEMKKMAKTAKDLKEHADKPASKAHKGLKTGGVVMGQGGYKAGGIIESKKGETMMHTAKVDHSPAKTGGVKLGNAGGYKTGGVAKANAGGYKKGGAAKKAYATGGVVKSGAPVAMPQGRKTPSKPVSISQLSGTFKKGGSVTPAEARLLKAHKSENASAMKSAKADSNEVYSKYQKMKDGGVPANIQDQIQTAKNEKAYKDYEKSRTEENEGLRNAILGAPGKLMEGIKGFFSKPPEGSVTKTEKSVTVTPAKKRGGSVKC